MRYTLIYRQYSTPIGTPRFFTFSALRDWAHARIPKNILSAKQSIKLTGLGVEAFDACAAAILEVQQVFSTCLLPNAMQKWTPTMEHGYLVLEVSNWYFSNRDIADDNLHLLDCIDLLHLLCNWMPFNTCHLKDNEVLYFERQKSERFVYPQ